MVSLQEYLKSRARDEELMLLWYEDNVRRWRDRRYRLRGGRS